MNEVHNFLSAVYVFENLAARRVKVGITSDTLLNRLKDLNDIWSGRKVMCQICGSRLVNRNGRVPAHVVSGVSCAGGNALPFEKDSSLAKIHLKNMESQIKNLSGTEKNSSVRRLNNTKKRIALFESASEHVGTWQLSVVYYTKRAEMVESMTHKMLSEYLDKHATIGEIFICTSSEASNAVESVLCDLELLQSSTKKYSHEIGI